MNTKALRQKILDLAIRGKLVPQDPNDEPASVLLDRIRAEKERLIAEGKIKRPKSKTSSSASPYQKFEIPESWEWTTLGEIFSMQAGKNIQASELKEYSSESPYPCYGGNGIRGYLPKYSHEGFYPIVGRQGALCGNINMASGKFYATEHAVVVDYFSNTEPLLCRYFLEVLNLNQYATATAQPGLSVAKIEEVPIPLPPIQEQTRIIKAVENLFERITLLEKNTLTLTECISTIKSKILELAMQGKLVPQDPADEPAADMLRRINPKAKILTDIPHYPKLPDNWVITAFTDVCESRLGKTLNSEKDEGSMSPYLCALNVKQGYFDLSIIKQTRIQTDEYERYSVMNGDLLVCEGGDVGRAAIWQGDRICYQNALHRVRPLGNILQKYLYYSLLYSKNKNVIDDLCSGVTIKHFTTKSMSKLSISLPPIAEQRRIVNKIEELFSTLDKIEESLN